MATKDLKALAQLKKVTKVVNIEFERDSTALDTQIAAADAVKDSKRLKTLCRRRRESEKAYANLRKLLMKAVAEAHGY